MIGGYVKSDFLEQLVKGIAYTAKLIEETRGMKKEMREGFFHNDPNVVPGNWENC